MCRVYEGRFGVPFNSFQNAVDTRRWAGPDSAAISTGSTVRILYTGSVLEFAQRASLATCCQAVANLRRQGLDVVLDIYSPAFQTSGMEHLFRVDDGIRLHDVISDDERYFRTLAEADILLLPVNFDPASIAYIRLSMPTKVPSYLVSGTPVLVYGPPEVAQVRYAREAEWGHVVQEQGAEAVAAGLRTLIEDQALRQSLSGNARRLAAERHDVTAVRTCFQAALASAEKVAT
jgi:glycosyltransferase involved in cell wall biosynthesis